MISNPKTRAAFTCGIALATLGFSALAAEPDAPSSSDSPATTAADIAAPSQPSVDSPTSLPPPAPPAPAASSGDVAVAPQTRLRFDRGTYKAGIERLRVVRRENTGNYVAGQIALNVALSLLAGGVAFGAQGFSKDDLHGSALDALKDDPVAVNPAIDDLNEALSKVATDIYRKRAEAAHATALTDGSTPEEIEAAGRVPKEADTPLLPGPWHLVYENLTGTDELFRLKFGAELGRPGFMRPPAECRYQSEPIAWTQWQADNWQRLREERAKAVASCTETLAATPEKRW